MIVDEQDLASAQLLAFAINDLFVGCTPAVICTALGTVLACADVDDNSIDEFVEQILRVIQIIRAHEALEIPSHTFKAH